MESNLSAHHTHFLGFRKGTELAALYASCDLFVFPSTTDTLGQVVMESQASGLPVIVTDQGGPKEIVQDGQTGYVLEADAKEQWDQNDCRSHNERHQAISNGSSRHPSNEGVHLCRILRALLDNP